MNYKVIGAGIGAFILILVVMFGLSSLGMVSKSFFGTWNEQIRYDIHKESQTYRDGMQRNLSQLLIDYRKADPAGQAAIKATVRHQYSQTDTSSYPAHLKDFLRETGAY